MSTSKVPLCFPMAGLPPCPEIEELGSHAIEVQASFCNVVINTRHLTDPSGKPHDSAGKVVTLVGCVLGLVGLVTLVGASIQDGHEKERFEAHQVAGKDLEKFPRGNGNPALDVIFSGSLITGVALAYMGLKRWGHSEKDYIIGSVPGVDAPMPPEYLGGERFRLVRATGADFSVQTTPQMQGEVYLSGQAIPLAQFVQQRGPAFPLPEGARVRLQLGEAGFLVSSVAKPRTLPVPIFLWSWAEQKFTAGAAAVLLLFLVIIFSVPPDPKSLSLDLLNTHHRFVNFLIKPPEVKEEEVPEFLNSNKNDDKGGKGKRHKGDDGKMGKEPSKNKQGLYA
ncbi:MAG: hypothetical protein KA712_07970 [Myxococcales bacterium]|nr:hypothetical protein [Myxococcales bacterium]